MNAKDTESLLVVLGEPRALILDYLDCTKSPSIGGYFDYKRQEEHSFNAQARWDALNRSEPILPNSPITGDTITGLMSNLRK